MERGLVVLEDSGSPLSLLEEAGQFAVGSNADLVIFSYLNTDEVESNRSTIDAIGAEEGQNYGPDVAVKPAEQFAVSSAEDTLSTLDVEYSIESCVVEEGELASEILKVASSNDCDHIFLLGRKRSPTGKAIFGDHVQHVILNFDGRVTVDIDGEV